MSRAFTARKPGWNPAGPLPAVTIHSSISIRSTVSGPRAISAAVIGRRPIRFVNQLESGTSSSVLTFTAGIDRRSPCSVNWFDTKSYVSLSSRGAAPLASNAASSSVASGSSGKKRGPAAWTVRSASEITNAVEAAAFRTQTARFQKTSLNLRAYTVPSSPPKTISARNAANPANPNRTLMP